MTIHSNSNNPPFPIPVWFAPQHGPSSGCPRGYLAAVDGSAGHEDGASQGWVLRYSFLSSDLSHCEASTTNVACETIEKSSDLLPQARTATSHLSEGTAHDGASWQFTFKARLDQGSAAQYARGSLQKTEAVDELKIFR